MTVVIKFGGNAMVDGDAMTAFIAGVKQLEKSGAQPVVVHGGGPQISAGLKAAGITSEFKGGYRVTTAESVQVVRDVLVNEVNKELVELMNASEVSAVSMPGDIDGLLTAEHRTVLVDGVQEDIGLVGEVVAVDRAAAVEGAQPVVRVTVVAGKADQHHVVLAVVGALDVLAPFVTDDVGLDADLVPVLLDHLCRHSRIRVRGALHCHRPEVDGCTRCNPGFLE